MLYNNLADDCGSNPKTTSCFEKQMKSGRLSQGVQRRLVPEIFGIVRASPNKNIALPRTAFPEFQGDLLKMLTDVETSDVILNQASAKQHQSALASGITVLGE